MDKDQYEPRPHLTVAVVMRREAVPGPQARWQPWRWVLDEVMQHEDSFGITPRLLLQEQDLPGAGLEKWLHGGLKVELFTDDAEGYYLNASSPAPCWFVLWRMEGEDAEGARAVPTAVSLSYHDAGRWLDAQETVEQLPAPPDVVAWLQAFVDAHYVPEPKRRRRPQSFRALNERFDHGTG